MKKLRFLCVFLFIILAILIGHIIKASEENKKAIEVAYQNGMREAYSQVRSQNTRDYSKENYQIEKPTSVPVPTMLYYTFPPTSAPFTGLVMSQLATEAPLSYSFLYTPTPPQKFILNTNTHVFHYPNCSSVTQMKEKNKKEFFGTAEAAQQLGYSPCGRCHPR